MTDLPHREFVYRAAYGLVGASSGCMLLERAGPRTTGATRGSWRTRYALIGGTSGFIGGKLVV